MTTKITYFREGYIIQFPYHTWDLYDYLLNRKATTMQKKAFVLLSGGVDSTTCLYKAIFDFFPDDPGIQLAYGDPDIIKQALQDPDVEKDIPWVEAISVDYGQRHKKELEYARSTCRRLGIRHHILDIGNLLGGKTVMLSGDSVGEVDIPDIDYADIKGVSPTYVPFRNGTLLSAITAQAQKYVNEQIQEACQYNLESKDVATVLAKDLCGVYFGAHAEDAHNWAYPDCTPEFIGAMANAIYVGTYFCVRLHTPLMWLKKKDIVLLGDSLGVDFSLTWSCYAGEKQHCGTCPTCRSRKQAFIDAVVRDPTEYAA